MIVFPNAKINLGLNIIERRPDGYHNLETIFYPVPLKDAIEVNEMHQLFPSDVRCDIKVSNATINGNEQDNLVVLAYKELSKYYNLPRIHVHLFKGIPSQAGLGGGSSDCAYMLNLLNQMFKLNIPKNEMLRIASNLGADCPFFIDSIPAYGQGIGEILTPIDISLKGWYITIIHPNIPVSTKEAFSHITPRKPIKSCIDIIKQPIETWKDELVNDFETSVFIKHPELLNIKNKLYELGATYASMSGSGSSLFAISRLPILYNNDEFKGMTTFTALLE